MKALVVGNGVMGGHHARTLRRLGVHVETVDSHGEADHRTLAEAPAADFACVATPPAFLADQAVEAMGLGMDVLVEKPMAIDHEQARRILRAELDTGRKVRVGYTERWNPAVSMAKAALPLIGELRHVEARRLGRPGRCPHTGPALDLLTHDIDTLRFLGLWPAFRHSVSHPGLVTATYRLTEGATATLTASHLHLRKERTLAIVGDEGVLSVDHQRQTVIFEDQQGARELEVNRREPLEAQWLGYLNGEGVATGDALATLDLALRTAQAPDRDWAAA